MDVVAAAARPGWGEEEGRFEELLKMAQDARKTNSEEELREIYKALLENEPNLADAGYNGNGHFMTCPNGHIYVVGNCGGPMESSQCPECGAAIGGANHRLNPGNRAATEFLAAVRGRG
ncbi:hypothetical protein N2152v2_001526 [Parachlorella kessleri]